VALAAVAVLVEDGHLVAEDVGHGHGSLKSSHHFIRPHARFTILAYLLGCSASYPFTPSEKAAVMLDLRPRPIAS
jgi:hypothetical protein